jgi:hypothetical protein
MHQFAHRRPLGTPGAESDRVRWAPLISDPSNPMVISGARLRHAVVVIARVTGPVAPSEVLAHLKSAEFCVPGLRPLEIVRSALKAEARGVHGRPASLRRTPENLFAFVPGSLTERTIQRWEMQFAVLVRVSALQSGIVAESTMPG